MQTGAGVTLLSHHYLAHAAVLLTNNLQAGTGGSAKTAAKDIVSMDCRMVVRLTDAVDAITHNLAEHAPYLMGGIGFLAASGHNEQAVGIVDIVET